MSCTRRHALVVLVESACGALPFTQWTPVAAQSELVVFKEGTTLYHRPGCPVIRDGAGVLALTKAQAEGRGYKPHRDCDPSNPNALSLSEKATAAQPPATVYVDGSKYYHRKSCPKLDATSKTMKAVRLDAAAKAHWPCPTCKAPVFKKKIDTPILGTSRRRGG